VETDIGMHTLMAKMPAQAGVSAKELLDQFHVPEKLRKNKGRFRGLSPRAVLYLS